MLENRSSTHTDILGRTLCVGKPLALAQMRFVAAGLLKRYDIQFAPGMGDGEAVVRDLRDQLTARPGELKLVFKPRI